MANLFKSNQPERLLSEEEVKKRLGINDFRHLDKKTVVKFMSMIPDMDPEVAMKAIEQFPQLVNLALDYAKEFKANYEAGLKANDKSSQATLAIINSIVDALSKELQQEDRTEEERKEIRDQLMQLGQLTAQIHRDDQNFILKGLGMFASIAGAVVLGAAAVLGANGNIELPDLGKTGNKSNIPREL